MTPLGVLADLAPRPARPRRGGRAARGACAGSRRPLRLLYVDAGRRGRRCAAAVRAVAPAARRAGSRTAPDIDADERRERIKQILLRIEQRLREVDHPLVIVGEDVHWADDESLELFRELLAVRARGRSWSCSPRAPTRASSSSPGVARAEVIRLEELDRGRAPGADLAPVRARRLERELARQILARTGGNAFFIHEMLDSLIERGILVADAGGRRAPGPPALGQARRAAARAVHGRVAARHPHRPAAAGREGGARLRRGARPPLLRPRWSRTCSAAPAARRSTALVERGLLLRHGARSWPSATT